MFQIRPQTPPGQAMQAIGVSLASGTSGESSLPPVSATTVSVAHLSIVLQAIWASDSSLALGSGLIGFGGIDLPNPLRGYD